MQDYLILGGRLLFSVVFIIGAVGHFTETASMAEVAAGRGVPWPVPAVLLSGLLMLAGGLSILLGWGARAGGVLLLISLIPVTLLMHRPLGDPLQAVHFLKNLALMGGTLFFIAHGAGALSLDTLLARRPRRATAKAARIAAEEDPHS